MRANCKLSRLLTIALIASGMTLQSCMFLALPFLIYEARGKHKKDVSSDPRFCKNIGVEFETVTDLHLRQWKGEKNWVLSFGLFKDDQPSKPCDFYRIDSKVDTGARFKISQILILCQYELERSQVYIMAEMDTEFGSITVQVTDLFNGCYYYISEPDSIHPNAKYIIKAE